MDIDTTLDEDFTPDPDDSQEPHTSDLIEDKEHNMQQLLSMEAIDLAAEQREFEAALSSHYRGRG